MRPAIDFVTLCTLRENHKHYTLVSSLCTVTSISSWSLWNILLLTNVFFYIMHGFDENQVRSHIFYFLEHFSESLHLVVYRVRLTRTFF